MLALAQAIHSLFQGDSTPTIGLQTIIGKAAPNYGVYRGHFPEIPNFKGSDLLTWEFLALTVDASRQSDMRLRQHLFAVTAWSPALDNIENIHHRVRYLCEGQRWTAPTADCQLIKIHFDSAGPNLWDDEFQVHYRAEHYRAYYREDITVAGDFPG